MGVGLEIVFVQLQKDWQCQYQFCNEICCMGDISYVVILDYCCVYDLQCELCYQQYLCGDGEVFEDDDDDCDDIDVCVWKQQQIVVQNFCDGVGCVDYWDCVLWIGYDLFVCCQ